MSDFNQPIDLGRDQLGMQAGIGGAGKNIFRGIRDMLLPERAEPKKKKVDPSNPEPDEIAGPTEPINLGRAMQLEEGMQEPPPLDIMQMGRPDTGNLNLRLMQEDPRIRQLTDLLNVSQGRFTDAPSRQKADFTAILASGTDVKTLQTALGKPWDSAWTHKEIRELVQFNSEVTDILLEHSTRMAKQLDDGYLSQDELLAFAYVEELAVNVQQKLVDSAAASGRSLGMFKHAQNSKTSTEYQEFARNILDINGGRDSLQERIKFYSEGDSVADVSRRVHQTKLSRNMEFIISLRYNTMLSSIRSHVANIAGSTFTTLYENGLIKPLQVGFNRLEVGIREAVPGIKPVNDVDKIMAYREAIPNAQAMLNGLTEGWKGIKQALAGKGEVEGKFAREINSRYDPMKVPKSTAGKVMTFPTRALEAEDRMFRSINYHMELSRLSHRRASHMALDAKEADAMYKEMMENPPDEFIKEANDYASTNVFANDPELHSKYFAALAKMASTGQGQNAVLQSIFPFVNTPANLVIYAKNNLGISSKMVKDLAGDDPVKRAEALSRLTLAYGMLHATSWLYESGRLSGVGHPDKGVRAAERMTSTTPSNSIKIGDKWYELNRLDPAGLIFGILGTFHERAGATLAEDPNADISGVAIPTLLEIAELTLDRSMLSGSADLFSIAQGGSSAELIGDVAGNIALFPAIITPGIARDLRMMADPHQRKMEVDDKNLYGIGSRILKRTMNAWPGLSDNLPPRRDWKGEPKQYAGNQFVNGLIPIPIHEPMTDKSSLALVQYGIHVSKSPTTLNLPESGLNLKLLELDWSGWSHDKLDEMIGKSRSTVMDKISSNKSFQKITSEIIQDGVIIDPFRYEEVKEEIQSELAFARQDATMAFLKWLDGRTTVPGPVKADGTRREIKLANVFNFDDFVGLEKQFQRGERPDISEIFQRKGRSVSPGTQTIIDQNIEF